MKWVPSTIACIALLLIGCDDRSALNNTASVEVVLKQGPVSAWRIPVTGRGTNRVLCRLTATGYQEEEFFLEGDELDLTIVDKDKDGTIGVSYSNSKGGSVSLTFKHPPPEVTFESPPSAIAIERGVQSIWKKTWTTKENREEPIFAVELVAEVNPTSQAGLAEQND